MSSVIYRLYRVCYFLYDCFSYLILKHFKNRSNISFPVFGIILLASADVRGVAEHQCLLIKTRLSETFVVIRKASISRIFICREEISRFRN